MNSMTVLALASASFQHLTWSTAAPLPQPLTNNAVAAAVTSTGPTVFSFLGLDTTKRWNGIQRDAYRWNLGTDEWRAVAPVPGPGRLAATAQAVAGKIYLFGGYTVAADGTERSLSAVDIYDADTGIWRRGTPIPVPVDDAVSGVWRDSLIFLVSGWHDRDNVADVQIYDPAIDVWRTATPIPGPPVFGHAGAIAGDHIVYIDGVRTNATGARFSIVRSAWLGEIDSTDPTAIRWSHLPDHPGPPLYRAAAGPVGNWIVFAGGTDNPYNYNGVGYDGNPSEPRSEVFAFDLASRRWVPLPALPIASMDHRGIASVGGALVIVGGMVRGRDVTDRVVRGRIEERR